MHTKTAWELYQSSSSSPSSLSSNTISFGCPLLDEAIGGIRKGQVTEVVGEAGSGKTQICLTLAVQTVLQCLHRHQEGSAAILSSGEGAFPIRRLSQVASSSSSNQHLSSEEVLKRIHIEDSTNADDILNTLSKKLPEMCQEHNVQLLILDSLAGLIRFEYDGKSTQEMTERTIFLFTLAKQLKWLADTFHLAVVIVNQVTAGDMDGMDGSSMPALGLAWSHCVNSRILLEKRQTLPTILDYPTESEPNDYNSIMVAINQQSNNEDPSHRSSRSAAEVYGGKSSSNNNNPSMTQEVHCDPRLDAGSSNTNTVQVNNEDNKRMRKSNRVMRLVFSPYRPSRAIAYDIVQQGIIGIQ
eukprot:gene4158-4567_t